jgi:hypothetical protein
MHLFSLVQAFTQGRHPVQSNVQPPRAAVLKWSSVLLLDYDIHRSHHMHACKQLAKLAMGCLAHDLRCAEPMSM